MAVRMLKTDATLMPDFLYEQDKLPIDKPVAQYIRQSTDGQKKKNKQSTAMQDEELHKRLLRMGWKEADILKLDLDSGMSGTKRIDERSDMNRLYQLIKQGKVGAVACYDPSRLFRDDTYTQSSAFVDLCHKHKIPVITWTRIYWTGRKEDKDTLFVKLMEAAKDLQTIMDRLIPAKLRAIEEDGSYGGHAIPMGYILGEETIEGDRIRKFYVVYEPHAELIRYLFRRFRELGGNIAKLARELRATGFRFPPFEGIKNVPHVGPIWKGDGYALGRQGLFSILTNTAYIGYYSFNAKGPDGTHTGWYRKNAHDPIVPMEDFLYAYEKLSRTTLDGEPNEAKHVVTRKKTLETEALLEHLLWNEGNPVYATSQSRTLKDGPVVKQMYVAKSNHEGDRNTELIMLINTLDSAYVDILLKVLAARREQSGLEDALYQRLQELQQEKRDAVVSIEDQIEQTRKAIARAERNKRIAEEEDYEPGIRDAIRDLKKLRPLLDTLLDKTERVEQEEAELAECENLLQCALHDWNGLTLEKKRRFVRLVTRSVNISEVSSHYIRIDIAWQEPLDCTITGYLYRAKGSRPYWTPEEDEILRTLYPQADRADILRALPNRAWVPIVQHAKFKGLRRHTERDTSGINELWTVRDIELVNRVGIGQEPVYWEVPTSKPFDGCSA